MLNAVFAGNGASGRQNSAFTALNLGPLNSFMHASE
jgi:hypothetical protein